MYILAVDDDPMILEILQYFLGSMLEHELVTAECPADALVKLRNQERRFDCFLLDIQMPGIDGIEFCKILRGMKEYKSTPILMLTAMSDKGYIDSAFGAGANDYITKPFELSDIKGRLGLVELIAADARQKLEKIDQAETLRKKFERAQTNITLHDPIPIYDVDGVIENRSMENYVSQLSRRSLCGSVVLGFTIRQASNLFFSLSDFDFTCVITDVSEVISDCLLPTQRSEIWLEFFTIIFVLYFIADISLKFHFRYRERLEQLKLTKEENKRTNAALVIKSQFLATVSHELRTPLTSIIGSLELMKSEKFGLLPETIKPIMGIAARNGQRLSTLIEDLLDLQNIESGEMVYLFEPIDVDDLVAEAVEATAGYAAKLGIHVATHLCGEDCQITGDRGRLIQVMGNLLSNAKKFSEEGGAVKVSVEILGARIRISVHDEGSGIPKGAKDRVFGRFSQLDSSDVRKIGGTGLGLNITKQIVERHNATIDYVSELGVGSTFYVEFDRLTDTSGPSIHLERLEPAA